MCLWLRGAKKPEIKKKKYLHIQNWDRHSHDSEYLFFCCFEDFDLGSHIANDKKNGAGFLSQSSAIERGWKRKILFGTEFHDGKNSWKKKKYTKEAQRSQQLQVSLTFAYWMTSALRKNLARFMRDCYVSILIIPCIIMMSAICIKDVAPWQLIIIEFVFMWRGIRRNCLCEIINNAYKYIHKW